MDIFSTYSIKIKHYNHIFKATVTLYRKSVDFFIDVCLKEWDSLSGFSDNQRKLKHLEQLCHKTKDNPVIVYDFDKQFYKYPSYLRRSAIIEAIGKVSSYKSNLANWMLSPEGREPSSPRAGYVYPCLYKDGMYKQTGLYEAKVKVFTRNTWDWITVSLRKSDIDYIERRCKNRRKCAPTLQKRGKEWFLDFPFEEKVTLTTTCVSDQTILAADLGINSAATVSVINAEGTILGRKFLKLPREQDSLMHSINRIKKAQKNGAKKTPRLWARAKGINNHIAVRTAQFIIDTAALYNVDVIVFEHLDTQGKKKGSKKQKLHLWKSQYVQAMVTDNAHRLGMRISHICAWGTSRLAFDGTGRVLRGKEADLSSYSICKFSTGKVYNCDLNAAYNIGARYFIREIFKTFPEKARLALEAKIPQAAKRSTCTLSTLINLNAELISA